MSSLKVDAYSDLNEVRIDDNGVAWLVRSYESMPGSVYAHRQVDVKQLPVNVENFSCGTCESSEYEPHYTSDAPALNTRIGPNTVIGPGRNASSPKRTTYAIRHYTCSGCGITFGDPEKFSSNQPAKVIEPEEGPIEKCCGG